MRRKLKQVLSLLLAIALLLPAGPLAPVAANDPGDHIVLEADFDEAGNTEGWFGRGDATVTQVTYDAHAGDGSLLVTKRTANWQGPGIFAEITTLIPGETYTFSVFAKLREGAPAPTPIQISVEQIGLSGDDQYLNIADETVGTDEWVQIKGTKTLDERATRFQIYVEAPGNDTVDFYIDTFRVTSNTPGGGTPPAKTVILHQDFEDNDLGGWLYKSWGTAGKFDIVAGEGVEGSQALRFYDRVSGDSNPLLNLTPFFRPGGLYEVSLQIRLAEGTSQYHLASKIKTSEEEDYPWVVGNHDVNDTDWTTFKFSQLVPDDLVEFLIWLEPNDDNAADIYIDEVLIVEIGDVDDVDKSGLYFDFEDRDLNGWVARNGTDAIEVTDEANHTEGGSYSLLTEASEQYQGPLLDIEGKMAPGHIYDLSVWVKMKAGVEPTLIRMSLQLGSSGPYENITTDTLVTDAEWVELSTRYTMETYSELLYVYVELVDETDEPKPFYIDDFELKYVGAVAEAPPVQTDVPQLRDLYEPYFKIGAAVENNHLQGQRKELLDLHYNSLVAENVMKPEYMSRGWDDFYFDQGNVLADYVRDYNADPDNETAFDLRFHTLVWHSQGADWMLQDDDGNWLEPNEENKQLVLDRMENYIRAAIQEFADIVTDIDVVNEVIDENRPDGMRDSHWYRITGKDFIKHAFNIAHDELVKQGRRDQVRLYINDYNTHNPRKRDFLYDLVMELREEGVPIDGVGHQTHINVAGPSIQQIADSIQLFGEAGFDNQITELDVSIYTDNSTVYDPIPEDILIKQGYRYKELFEALIRLDDMGRSDENPEGWISNVTLWGIADNHTWLHNRGTTRQDAPFPFDRQYQVKPAFWGMVAAVDEEYASKLPLNPNEAITPQGTPKLHSADDLIWSTVPPMLTDAIGSLQGIIKTLWDEEQLYVRVEVRDETISEGDQIEIFVEDAEPLLIERSHSSVIEIDGGYVVIRSMELDGDNELERQVKFDVRITDMGENDGSEHGGNGAIVSWSDPRNAQDADRDGYGTLLFVEETKLGQAGRGTPTIDGVMESGWRNAPVYKTEVIVEQNGDAAATAEFRVLWDDDHLYVYAEVTDSLLSDESENPWEQDSIEIFVDQNNGKTNSYEADDGQYRVNFNNERSVGGNADLDNFHTATRLLYEDDEVIGYAVEAAITLDQIEPKVGDVIGFDFQVNNDQDGDGNRDSVLIWSDPTGLSYTDTSRLGVMELVRPSSRRVPRHSGGVPPGSVAPSPLEANVDADGNATVSINEAALRSALENAQDGRLILEVQGADRASSVSVHLPGHLVTLIAEASITTIEIDTGIATIELPLSLIADVDRGENVALLIAKVESENLHADVQEQVGDHPVYELILMIGDEVVSDFGAEYVRVSYPFTLPDGHLASQIVTFHLTENGDWQLIKNGRFNRSTGMVEFITSHFSQFTALPVQVHFNDLAQAPWAEESIAGLSAREIVKGMTADQFAPQREVTRAEFVQMLVQTFDLQAAESASAPFADVNPGAWYEPAIQQAYALGIVRGKDDGTFGVHDRISRQDLAVMAHRALEAAGIALDPVYEASEFGDASAIADYAWEAVSAMQQAGVIAGMPDGNFAPTETASRAQAAVILYQLLQRMH